MGDLSAVEGDVRNDFKLLRAVDIGRKHAASSLSANIPKKAR